MTDYEVHPVTGLFPLLPSDELDELAADITERGLLHPVVLDGEGRVLDGRNRLAACERAGVEPEFETYDGDDPDGYALSVNIQRRNLTRGQAAMVAYETFVIRGESQRDFAANHGLSQSRIAKAATVHDYARELVAQVISSAVSLDAAYEDARKRKTAADSDAAKLDQLRADDPELAERVVEGELSLRAALVELESRRAERKRQQRVATELLGHLATVAGMAGAGTAERYEPDLALPGREVTADVIDLARQALDEIETTLKKRGLL